MALDLVVTLVAGFLAVALIAGYGVSSILAALSPERRRLRQLATAGGPADAFDSNLGLVDSIDPRFKSAARRAQIAQGDGPPAAAPGDGRIHESDSGRGLRARQPGHARPCSA